MFFIQSHQVSKHLYSTFITWDTPNTLNVLIGREKVRLQSLSEDCCADCGIS